MTHKGIKLTTTIRLSADLIFFCVKLALFILIKLDSPSCFLPLLLLLNVVFLRFMSLWNNPDVSTLLSCETFKVFLEVVLAQLMLSFLPFTLRCTARRQRYDSISWHRDFLSFNPLVLCLQFLCFLSEVSCSVFDFSVGSLHAVLLPPKRLMSLFSESYFLKKFKSLKTFFSFTKCNH